MEGFPKSVIIIDSNEDDKELLVALLNCYECVKITGLYKSAESVLKKLGKFTGVLFIEKNEMLKINLLEPREYEIIVTDMKNDIGFVINALNLHCVYYLIKPVDKKELNEGLKAFFKKDKEKNAVKYFLKQMDDKHGVNFTHKELIYMSGLKERTYYNRIDELKKNGIVELPPYKRVPYSTAIIIASELGFKIKKEIENYLNNYSSK